MTKIDWSDETINPLGHGCYGTGTKEKPAICEYCYAAKMAKRNMRGCDLCGKFIPHAHFEQLDKLRMWKKSKTVFIQSMGDLFGDWVPDEWIKKVFNACNENPQHRYLFLTKNPKKQSNYSVEFTHDKKWAGITITNQKDLDTNYKYLRNYSFYSIEPLQEKINFTDRLIADWLIIGAETGNRKDKIIPERKWIENIVNYCKKTNVPVFMKKNLKEIWNELLIQQFPWQ